MDCNAISSSANSDFRESNCLRDNSLLITSIDFGDEYGLGFGDGAAVNVGSGDILDDSVGALAIEAAVPGDEITCSGDSGVIDITASDVDLLGLSVHSVNDAYQLYNDYAFRVGFSVRKGKQMYKDAGKTLRMKKFLCSKAGFKKKTENGAKCYSKLELRTGCKAYIRFDLDSCGVWTVTKHEKDHNHELCSSSKTYLLRSHRRLSGSQLLYLKDLKESGIHLSDGVRFLKKQSGGSPFVGFTSRDAYNCMSSDKLNMLDGTDSNSLIEIFRKRQLEEHDFFFDFELDEESRLCSFFWRDSKMKEDYKMFGDLLVHDTTYRTNKYDMICAPFVGMNHHCMNVMFGCGFLLNERIESFEWLFRTFLRSMDGIHPQTIMTDQCAAMSYAIGKVFPRSRHRLCIWHIGENSKKHIKSLRNQEGFVDSFNYLLKYTDTEAEFDLYWNSLVTKYKCEKNSWMDKLYKCRDKWCPAFSKDYFSGGVLSSQRSETTNHSVSRRLSRTAGLCDFYKTFVGVVGEWRSKENGEDLRCLQGAPAMVVDHVKLLSHARDVYTIEIYSLFEHQFLKSSACFQILVFCDHNVFRYHVWRPDIDIIRHAVDFNSFDLNVSCSCKLFSELGILCCHALRILSVHCVSAIPNKYIMKRWTKGVIADRNMNVSSVALVSAVCPSVWRIQMLRKFQSLLFCSEQNSAARRHCEEAVENARKHIEVDVGPIYIEECEDVSNSIIQNPVIQRIKGGRNKRPKSIIEKKCRQSKGRREYADALAVRTKQAA